MENTNNVTIDAAYFNHLFTRAVERERLWSDREGLILECEKIAKERDELKAALERANQTNSAQADQLRDALNENEELKAKLDCADVDRETYKDRAEAAERCIDTIAINLECLTSWENKHKIIEDAIRAYREKKEAAR